MKSHWWIWELWWARLLIDKVEDVVVVVVAIVVEVIYSN